LDKSRELRNKAFLGVEEREKGMDFTDAQKEKAAKAIGAMLSDGYEFAKSNRNFIRWMTTSSLAILAFFMTVLLQVRLKTEIPLKPLAITAFALLFLSILTGFYARLRFELKDWFSKATGMFMSTATILRMVLDQSQKTQDLTAEEAKPVVQNLDDLSSKIELARTQLSKVNPARIIIIQGTSLVLGICAISFYVFYYLFIVTDVLGAPH
jgi:hypothetical protein